MTHRVLVRLLSVVLGWNARLDIRRVHPLRMPSSFGTVCDSEGRTWDTDQATGEKVPHVHAWSRTRFATVGGGIVPGWRCFPCTACRYGEQKPDAADNYGRR